VTFNLHTLGPVSKGDSTQKLQRPTWVPFAEIQTLDPSSKSTASLGTPRIEPGTSSFDLQSRRADPRNQDEVDFRQVDEIRTRDRPHTSHSLTETRGRGRPRTQNRLTTESTSLHLHPHPHQGSPKPTQQSCQRSLCKALEDAFSAALADQSGRGTNSTEDECNGPRSSRPGFESRTGTSKRLTDDLSLDPLRRRSSKTFV
jgi:hypothetical protein